ncbi:hypothetical protein GALMADRAFT_250705 [Galerina marginata CBS 339.88]|uniref:Pali-domain-containing protein n=1 Tax=Galerina marginata (strain CBS 339.88) TaxID=685588 RepID=A0A067SSS7_GALM3|nr:hypothetical protein GALMADRAFT_250705 [Galerina marginata CBS 339.88]
MSRAFCIPGVLFLVCALVLSFLVSVSLPFLPAIDIARTHFGNGQVQTGSQGISQIRFGIWAACYYDTNDARTCLKTGHAYNVEITNPTGSHTANVRKAWTRGLAVHPVATAATFIALLLSLSTHITVTLIASIMSFLAALLTLIAFAIDIALFALLKHEMNKLQIGANTVTAPGFWMTFVTLILLLLAGCTVCFGRRRDRMSGATTSYPMSSTKGGFFSRFRRN